MIELFPGMFVAIFTNDAALSELSKWALRIYMAGVVLMGAQIGCQQTFVALGNSKISAFLAVFRKIIMLIPLIYILPALISDQVLAVFLAEPIADVVASVTTTTVFLVTFKGLMRKMREKKAGESIPVDGEAGTEESGI